jgi:hypothetical protein
MGDYIYHGILLSYFSRAYITLLSRLQKWGSWKLWQRQRDTHCILCDNKKVNPAKTIESTILAHQDHNNNLSVFRWDFGMIEDHGIQESHLEEDSNGDGLTTGAALWRFLHGN